MTDSLPAPDVTWSLPTHHLGRRVHVYSQLDSTNTIALSLGNDSTNHGLVILAHDQTAGRGQYGRIWQAPAGSSVLMSLLLFPPPALTRPVVLTAWAAVSVCDLISKQTGLPAIIKWPNDVYVHGKKVCGILIEQRSSGSDRPPAIAVGIGLNVSQPAEFFERAGLTLGGSLLTVAGKTLDATDVARRLIHILDEGYGRLHDGDYRTLEASWKAQLGLIGAEVEAETTTTRRRGRLLDVTLDAVLLDDDAPSLLRIAPEAVRHIHAIT
jgi:BirA family biotin operon repressor/biotin-[acetyl-CoA-carboxylase] ligase